MRYQYSVKKSEKIHIFYTFKIIRFSSYFDFSSICIELKSKILANLKKSTVFADCQIQIDEKLNYDKKQRILEV